MVHVAILHHFSLFSLKQKNKQLFLLFGGGGGSEKSNMVEVEDKVKRI